MVAGPTRVSQVNGSLSPFVSKMRIINPLLGYNNSPQLQLEEFLREVPLGGRARARPR